MLLVSHEAFAPRGNGGIVLSNLFEGWPARNLAVIDYAATPPAMDRSSGNWRLSKVGILRGALGLPVDGRIVAPGDLPTGAGRGARINGFFGVHLTRPLGEAMFRLPSVFPESLRRWVADFDPEVCLSPLGSGLMLRTVVRIAAGARIPIVPYFMDDWIKTRYEGDLFEGWLRSSARHWLAECLKRAPVRMVVTREMAEEYGRRYGGAFVQMGYAVSGTRESLPREASRDEPVRLVYMGGFEPGRPRVLRAIGDALMVLANEGLRAELSIYAPPAELAGFDDLLTLPPVMKAMVAVPYGSVQEVLAAADILVHAESFDPVDRLWTRYSLSTKIPEYLMAGRCILAYGPPEISSIRYVRETGGGIVVDSADPAALVGGLRALLTDADLRRRLGVRGHAAATERHDGVRQRQRFLTAIRAACGREVAA